MSAAAPARAKHILTAAQFDRPFVDQILARATKLEGVRDVALAGKIMASLFFEPSTRTRLSFESAMVRRGGAVIGSEAAGQFSSATKGESLEDTVRIVSGYADAVVIRHSEVGAAERAASASSVPVINAGDGSGQHPTQALLDLYTIATELGAINGKHLAIAGDLKHSRTVHSLVQLASLYSVRISLVSPAALALPEALRQELHDRAIPVVETTALEDVLGDCDVLYQTRLQRERLPDELRIDPRDLPVLDAAVMRKLNPRAIVMHPLPRAGEIDLEVDGDGRAAYFRQAAYGVTIRMVLLELVLQ